VPILSVEGTLLLRATLLTSTIALALVIAATTLVSPTGAAGPSCRSSFAGCRTRAQKIRFCRAACVTTREVCEKATQW
jgi:hypothetical protein